MDNLCAESPSCEYKEHIPDESKYTSFEQGAAEKNSLLWKGKKVNNYPGLFKLKPHCTDSLLLLSLRQCFIHESKPKFTKKTPKLSLDCQMLLFKILDHIGQSTGKNTSDLWVLKRKFYKAQRNYWFNCCAWITGKV